MKLRSIALGSIASAALLTGGAFAADLPVRSAAPAPVYVAPIFSWSGFYIGLNAGGAWTSDCSNYTLLTGSTVNNWGYNCGSSDVQFTGGAQIGYNFQSGNFVFGVEADINGLGNSNGGSREVAVSNFGTFRVNGVGDPGVFGTVRARLGFAADRALFYVTGGLAWASGGNDPAISYWDSQPPVTGDADLVYRRDGIDGWGWTLGAGVEYAFTNNWTARIEYLYVDLGNEGNTWTCTVRGGYGGSCGRFDFGGRADANFNVVRVGLNYKFGGAAYAAPVVARY